MRKWILGLGAGLVLALPALAGPDGWQRDSAYNQKFDPKSVVTINGTVTKIDRECHPMKGMGAGFAVTLKTAKGDELVQVGPSWFTGYYRQKWDVKVGDTAQVSGSRVTIDGKPVIMAIWGKKGDVQMACRNKKGVPVWDVNVEDF